MTHSDYRWQPLEEGGLSRVWRYVESAKWAQVLILTVAIFLLFLFTVLAAGVGVYIYYARELPSPSELSARSTPFESTKIYDRHGELLYEIVDPTGGRRTVVPIQEMPIYIQQATIATEDATFYSNPGFNPFAIARALWQDISKKRIVSGASGITQQLVKNLFLSSELTIERKIKEAILAAELTRRYPKETILEAYLNEVYYGNLAYGIAAAAETYFGKSVRELTLAECALLAGLPQSPVEYDPYTNLKAAKARQAVVLQRMVQEGYITQSQADEAFKEELHFVKPHIDMRAPHFVVYVRKLLEKRYGTEMLYRGGLRVYTTLDLGLQDLAKRIAQEHVKQLAEKNVTNAAIVALDPKTGQILVMQGSIDFFNEEIDGQVNVALRLRQPGSAIKPITYISAFEKGWTAATMVLDVEQEFPDGANPPYKPVNYDGKTHGPMSVRAALANSYNIPAVATLHFVGIPTMLEMAHRLGIMSLNRPDYGLSLTLGGGDVTLLELTAAYAAFANGGLKVNPVAILKIEDSEGNLIQGPPDPPWQRVLDPRHAYLISSILSDNEARTPAFGVNSPLKLSRPAAAKTGTTNDYRDGWTIGYTPQLVTGVWVGNNDYSPTKKVSGVRGAGPIWHDFMEEALKDQPVEDFVQPPGMVTVEVCAVSGMLPTSDCPHTRKEIFLEGTEPTEPCNVHTRVRICRISGLLATEFCPANLIEEKYFEVYPPEAEKWCEEHNIPQPPRESCPIHTFPAQVEISVPKNGEVIRGPIEIRGTVRIPDLDYYVLQYGIGYDPLGWAEIGKRKHTAIQSGLLGLWDPTGKKNGPYTLRVIAYDHHGTSVETRVQVILRAPTLQPTRTPTKTPESTPSPTPTILVPTFTPPIVPTLPPTHTPLPPASPTATRMPTPTLVPPTATITPFPSHTPIPPTSTRTSPPSETPTPSPTETKTISPTTTPTLTKTPMLPTLTATPLAPYPSLFVPEPSATLTASNQTATVMSVE